MFFFFFDPPFQKGQLCEIIKNDSRHYTMPKLFPDRIWERVVIDQVTDMHAWCYEDKPIRYRFNQNGRQVVEFDPRCVTSPYSLDQLKVVEKQTKTNWVNDWLKSNGG